MRWSLFTRDAAGTATGGIPAVDADVVIRRITTGKFVVSTPWTPDRWHRLPASAGLIIVRDSQTVLSGAWTRRSWRSSGSEEHPLGLIGLEGVTDDAIGQYRLVSPNPELPFDGQNAPGATAVWSMTGPVETVMHAVVALNAGPGARPERRVPALVMGPDLGRGPVVVWSSLRYSTVQEELRRLAAHAERAGDRLLPVFHQTDLGLTFEVLGEDDRTGLVVFGAGLGNLDDQEYIEDAGTAGLAIGAGKGEGAARLQQVAVTTDEFTLAFGTLPEVYVDRRDTEKWEDLMQAARDAVDDGVAKVSYRCTARDTAGTRYAREWNLNTRASVLVGPAGTDPDTGENYEPIAAFDDLVREAHLELNPTEGTDIVTAAIGAEGASTGVALPSLTKLAALQARVDQLQRSL